MYITVEMAAGAVFSDCVYRAARLARRLEVNAVNFKFNGIGVLTLPSAQYLDIETLDSKLFDAYDRKLTSLVIK
jgi:hypothetical protein